MDIFVVLSVSIITVFTLLYLDVNRRVLYTDIGTWIHQVWICETSEMFTCDLVFLLFEFCLFLLLMVG